MAESGTRRKDVTSARGSLNGYQKGHCFYCYVPIDAADGTARTEGGLILDLGCGSGRDSLAFLEAGLAVDAVDGSAEMVKAASELTGLRAEHATFADFEPKGGYDGIWACSSLLHVPAAELPAIVAKYAAALKPGGRFYLSFKIGDHDGMRNGRWFTDMTEQSFRRLIDGVEDLTVDRIDVTSDVRPMRSDEKWLNAWGTRS